jgi:hypothetical protein
MNPLSSFLNFNDQSMFNQPMFNQYQLPTGNTGGINPNINQNTSNWWQNPEAWNQQAHPQQNNYANLLNSFNQSFPDSQYPGMQQGMQDIQNLYNGFSSILPPQLTQGFGQIFNNAIQGKYGTFQKQTLNNEGLPISSQNMGNGNEYMRGYGINNPY